MIYTFLADQRTFGVNKDFREIDTTGIPPEIMAIQWDTERNTGVIHYTGDTFDEVDERDFEAERRLLSEARVNNKREDTVQPQYKRVRVRRPRKVLQSFDKFAELLTRWEAAAPPPEAPTEAPPDQVYARFEQVRELVVILREKGVLKAADIQRLKEI